VEGPARPHDYPAAASCLSLVVDPGMVELIGDHLQAAL